MFPRGAMILLGRPGLVASAYSYFVTALVVASICLLTESRTLLVPSYVNVVRKLRGSVIWVRLFLPS